MGTQDDLGSGAPTLLQDRWMQLTAGIIAMVAVANFQYAWTLFVRPLHDAHGWSEVEIQDGLYIYFVLAQTWLVPLHGYMAERFGPRRPVIVGGVLATLAWIINAHTSSLVVLYGAQFLGGCGSGIVYSISVGNALKWFADRRGLAAGLTAAAFGAGSAATILPILRTIDMAGYQTAFLWFGMGQGLVIVVAGSLMHFPTGRQVAVTVSGTVLQSRLDYTPRAMLSQRSFWLLYGMMTVGAIPGLLMIGQIRPIAEAFGIAAAPVSILGIDIGSALPVVLILDPLSGGLTRPVFGWLSDYIGRERAIFIAFALEGAALFALMLARENAPAFVVMSALAFFGFGAIFSLFPAVSADMFGRKYAATNYGLLYTAKGAAALLVALCNRLQAESGSWYSIFALMVALDWLAALLAWFVLKPMREREHKRS